MHTGEPKPGLSGLPHPCLFGSDRGAGFVPSIGGCAQGANRHQSRAKRVERGCRRLYRTIPVWRLKRSALFRDRPARASGVVASRWPDVNPSSGRISTPFDNTSQGPARHGLGPSQRYARRPPSDWGIVLGFTRDHGPAGTAGCCAFAASSAGTAPGGWTGSATAMVPWEELIRIQPSTMIARSARWLWARISNG